MTLQRKGAGETRDYVAYLLRLWRETGGETIRWRASLQDPHSGDRVGFISLGELFAHLRRETGDLLERDGEPLGDKGQDR